MHRSIPWSLSARGLLSPGLVLLALIFSSCGGDGGRWTKETTDSDGVRVVANGSVPRDTAFPLPILRYEDLAVIGEQTGEEHLMFSVRPSGGYVAGGPDGQIGYAERQPPELRVFGPEGSLQWVGGRQGGGPGEFEIPVRPGYAEGVGWVVNAALRHRLVVFDDVGNWVADRPMDEIVHGRYYSAIDFTPGGDFWMLAHHSQQTEEGLHMRYWMVSVDWETLEGAVADSFTNPSMVTEDSRNVMYDGFPRYLAVDDQGRAWLNRTLDYTLDVYGPGASSHWRVRRICDLHDYPPGEREAIESEVLMEDPEGQVWYRKLPSQQPAISGLTWTGAGELWVFQRAYVDSPLVQVDVFDHDGVFVRAFLADRDLRGMPIGEDHLWRSAEGEDGSPLLIRSRYWIEP